MKGKRTRNGLQLEAAEKREKKSTNAALPGLHQLRFAPFHRPSLSSFLSLCSGKQYENRNDRNNCDQIHAAIAGGNAWMLPRVKR